MKRYEVLWSAMDKHHAAALRIRLQLCKLDTTINETWKQLKENK
jgi:hypothetical protein